MRKFSVVQSVCGVVGILSCVALALGFSAHRATGQSEGVPPPILHLSGDVLAKNDDWLRTGVRLQAGDVVSIVAQGRVTLGQYTRDVGPNGASDGDGRLEAKVGSDEAFGVGAHYAFVDSTTGILKLRIRDSRRDDNAGSFHVDVYVIRGSSVPSEIAFREED